MFPSRDTLTSSRHVGLCHPGPLQWSSVMMRCYEALGQSQRGIFIDLPVWEPYSPLPHPLILALSSPCHCLMAVALASCQSTQRRCVFVCVPQSVNVQTDIQHHGMAGQSAVCHSNVGQSNMLKCCACKKGGKRSLPEGKIRKKITFRQIKKKGKSQMTAFACGPILACEAQLTNLARKQ